MPKRLRLVALKSRWISNNVIADAIIQRVVVKQRIVNASKNLSLYVLLKLNMFITGYYMHTSKITIIYDNISDLDKTHLGNIEGQVTTHKVTH